MSYSKGDVVVVKFPFVMKEGTSVIQKRRPAFVISDDKIKRRYKDVVLAPKVLKNKTSVYVRVCPWLILA